MAGDKKTIWQKALDAVKPTKEFLGANVVPATAETTQEMETGSPQSPNHEPNYGQTMKKPAEYDFESVWSSANSAHIHETVEHEKDPGDDHDL